MTTNICTICTKKLETSELTEELTEPKLNDYCPECLDAMAMLLKSLATYAKSKGINGSIHEVIGTMATDAITEIKLGRNTLRKKRRERNG